MFHKNARYVEEIDGELHLICNICKEVKHNSEFGKNNRNKHGISNYCRPCILKYHSDRKSYYGLKDITNDKDKSITINFFKSMDYDIDESIHNQFVEKIKNKYGVDLS